MPDSVAGRIRVDILASADRMKPGMREAKMELASFRQQYETTAKRVGKGDIAAALEKEKHAWQSAMTGVGGPLHLADGYQEKLDRQLSARQRNYQRWDGMIRDELSRGQSRTAALTLQRTQEAAAPARRSAGARKRATPNSAACAAGDSLPGCAWERWPSAR